MRQLIDQFVKFGIVGVIAFVIDYGVLMLLSQVVGIDPVISAGISFCISVVFNYLASMRFVFTHREDLSTQREFGIFIILSIIGLAINEACMLVGVSIWGDSVLAVTGTKIIATAVVMLWNFWSRKRWLDAGSHADASI